MLVCPSRAVFASALVSQEALNVYFVDAAKDVPDAAPAIVVKSIPLEWPVLSPLPLPDSTAVVSVRSCYPCVCVPFAVCCLLFES